jgi:hypothetical protein
MRDLKWRELDVVECLGVLPAFDEDDVVHKFRVERDGLLLELDICAYDSSIEIRLFRSGCDVPLFDTSFFVRGEIRHINEKDLSWLEFSDCLIAPIIFDEDSLGLQSPKCYVSFQIQMLPNFRLRFL